LAIFYVVIIKDNPYN